VIDVADDTRVQEATRSQLQHFQESDPNCRAMQLPEGIMLRYTQASSLYFYLRTGVEGGSIRTRVFASDSPYDRQKTGIGEVATPLFQARADQTHLEKLQEMLHAWVDFVKDAPAPERGFVSFPVEHRDRDR
jgi:hypothetical protein